MAFIKAHCHRELPKTGYLVCNGRFNIRSPQCVNISSALYLLEDLDKFISPNEWLVVCEWDHAFFITSKSRINGRVEAMEYSRDNGWATVYDCRKESIIFVNKIWKGDRHDRQK